MDEYASGSLLAHFGELSDPRVERTRKHKLIDIVAIAIAASSAERIIGWRLLISGK